MTDRPLLIVLTSLVAEGCPQLALQLARHWHQQGLEVELLCLQGQPTDLRPEFEALGIPIHTFRLGSGLARYPRLAWLSYRLCRRRRPTAVLSFPLGWHAFIAIGARLAGVPRLCAHVGNLPPVWTGNAFHKFKLLVQLGRPFTQRLLCCSEYVRAATVRDFGVRPRETRAVFNACDLDRFAAVQRPVRVHQPPRLAMVARLEGHKDQPTLIRAMALLRDQGLAMELWLIGEGSRRPQLEDLIQELQLSDDVQLLGSRRDIPELLAQLDLFVFSARPDEGFGIALAEAMTAGVPIVATDVGACREVLDGGRYGLLVEPSCPEALADGIREVLSDPASARQRAEAARQRALDAFSVEAMAEAYGQELGLTSMRVLHVLGGLHAAGIESLALQLIRHAPAGVQSELLNTNRSVQAMGTAFDQLKQEGRLEALHQWDPCDGPLLAWRSYRLCQRRQPDALLIYPCNRPMLWLALGARLAGVRRLAVALQNTAPADPQARATWHRLLAWFQRLGVLAVPCTEAIVASLQPLPPGLKLGAVIPNGCDVQAIAQSAAAARAQRPPDDARRVLMVARLDPIKDHATLIRAFAAVCQPGWELQLVGEGTERPRLEDLARELGLNPRKIFLGRRYDIPVLLGQADLFAFSTTAAEGFGIALIEALAAGLTIIASDVPACREVLNDGAAGFLVANGDPRAWSTCLLSHMLATELKHPPSSNLWASQYDAVNIARLWFQCLKLGT